MRFGEVEIDDAKIFVFQKGYRAGRTETIHADPHEQTKPINWLQSIDDCLYLPSGRRALRLVSITCSISATTISRI